MYDNTNHDIYEGNNNHVDAENVAIEKYAEKRSHGQFYIKALESQMLNPNKMKQILLLSWQPTGTRHS